jgi:UDP-glucose 4-epimerase
MRKILITGAFGFIGSATASRLAKDGSQVFGIGRGEPENQTLKKIFTEWYSAEITLNNLMKFGEYPDIIIHCAGGSSVGKAENDPEGDYRSTIDSACAVLEYIKSSTQSIKLLLISSAAVYGNLHNAPISELANPNPISVYGKHKLQVENIFLGHAKNFQLNLSIIRFFSLFGPNLKKQLLWDAANKARNGQNIFFGTGNEKRDFLYIDDATELIHLIASTNPKEVNIYNGGSGISTSIKEAVEILFDKLSTKESPQFSQKIIASDPIYLVSNNSKVACMGWKPKITLQDGLKNYADWFSGINNLS